SAPKRLANSRANSCCRHPHASTSSRDIAARSVRAISFRRGSNRRGTQIVESRSSPSASPNSLLTLSPIPPHATDENGGSERLPDYLGSPATLPSTRRRRRWHYSAPISPSRCLGQIDHTVEVMLRRDRSHYPTTWHAGQVDLRRPSEVGNDQLDMTQNHGS